MTLIQNEILRALGRIGDVLAELRKENERTSVFAAAWAYLMRVCL